MAQARAAPTGRLLGGRDQPVTGGWTKPILGFVNLVAGQIAAGLANAQAYEEERQRAEALAEIDRAKTTFFSNVSHEFRTPLTLMLSPLEEALALSDEAGSAPTVVPSCRSPTATEFGCSSWSTRCSTFRASRPAASQPVIEPTDLAAYTAELASNFRSALDKAGLRLVIDAEPLPQPVYVDRDMWEKIVLNLLSNAFKFTFEGEISVTVNATSDASHAEVSVRDTGTGIPAEELPHLFERFRRVEGARGRSIEGSGIGLALVQELVKLHGGEIGVRSEIGSGSTFTIIHSVRDSALTDGSPGRSASANLYPYAGPGLCRRGDGMARRQLGQRPTAGLVIAEDLGHDETRAASGKELVLLADDNNDMRDYVRRLLSEHYQVEARQRRTGRARRGMAATTRPHPERRHDAAVWTASACCRHCATTPSFATCQSFFCPLVPARKQKVEGLEAGANDYLSKPFSARELLARVRANIDMAALRREALRTENELRLQAQMAQERAETILASINDGLLVLDTDWRFTYANAAAERMLNQIRRGFGWKKSLGGISRDASARFWRPTIAAP